MLPGNKAEHHATRAQASSSRATAKMNRLKKIVGVYFGYFTMVSVPNAASQAKRLHDEEAPSLPEIASFAQRIGFMTPSPGWNGGAMPLK